MGFCWKCNDAAFPEKPMESIPIAPSISVFRVMMERNFDGNGKARPSRPRIWLGWLRVLASRNIEAARRSRRNTNDINDPSAIPGPPAISLDRVASI